MLLSDGLVEAEEEVDAVLVAAVLEVVEVVARDAVDAVLERALDGALARARVVRLERARAAVLHAHGVRVVGPAHAQHAGHLAGQHVAGHDGRQQRAELAVQHVLGERRLHDVGAVQAVDAVGAEHALLLLQHAPLLPPLPVPTCVTTLAWK